MSTRREFILQTAIAGAAAVATTQTAHAARDEASKPSRTMRTYKLAHTDLVVSRIAYGCMQLGGSWDRKPLSTEAIDKADTLIRTAYDQGITLFDHADLYCFGKSEAVFGEVLKRTPGLRNRIVVQSKCGIRFPADPATFDDPPAGDPKRYDNSRDYIMSQVEGSLRRLGTDRLDILLLHRPDALVEPEEVAKAFDDLQRSGKVRYFGVSNHTVGQMELLRKYIRQPIVVNQVRLGLLHSYMIADGLESGLDESEHITHDYLGVSGVLDYCRLNEIRLQGYFPLQGGILSPREDAEPAVKATAQLLKQLATEKNTTPSAVALAWVLRHPAGIVPLSGSTNPEHLKENCAADGVTLTHGEWYGLFCAGAGISRNKL